MFKRSCNILLAVFLAAGLTTGTAWAAESPLSAWKLDPSKTRMPDEMKVESQGANKYAFDFGAWRRDGGGLRGTDQPGGYGGTLLSVKAEALDTSDR